MTFQQLHAITVKFEEHDRHISEHSKNKVKIFMGVEVFNNFAT